MTIHHDGHQNATPAYGSRDFIASLRQMPDRGLLHQKNMLAGWITLIADDRGMDARQVAGATGIDRELASAILSGAVLAVPLSILDRALRRLENRPH